MIMLKYLLVAIAVLMTTQLVSAGEKYMIFETPPASVTVSDAVSVIAQRASKVDWYASWPTKYVVKLFARQDITLNFHCTVNNLDNNYAMTEITFCFNRDGKENCKSMPSTIMRVEVEIFPSKANSPNAALTFNPITGGLATISSVGPTVDVSMDFYCSMKSSMGEVKSNIVRIIDWRESALVQELDFPKGPFYTDQPVSVPCAEKSTKVIPKEIAPVYTWQHCNNKDKRFCKSAFIKGESVQILNNGTLYIPFFDTGLVKEITGHYISCFIDSVERSTSTGKISFQSGTSPERIRSLRILEPSQTGTSLELINTKDRIPRYCNFQTGPGTVTVKWFKEENGQRIELTPQNSNDYRIVFWEPHGILFQGLYNDKTPGKYICQVTWIPEDGYGISRPDPAEAFYDVSIRYYPEASRDMVPQLYVVSGRNGTFQCSFINPFPKDKNPENKVIPSLEVNGVALNLKNKADFDASVESLNAQFITNMATLKLSVTPLNPQPSDNLTYTAIDMTTSNAISNFPSTHMVTCIGKNTLGAVRKNILMQVVPQPEFSLTPSDTNCTSCLAMVEHEFKCIVSNLQKYNTTTSPVIIYQYWKLGDDPIVQQDNKFVAISLDNTTLTLKNMTSREDIDTFNKHYGNLTCVVSMSYPSSMQEPNNLRTDSFGRKYFYISSNDPTLTARLSTRVRLTEKPVAAANMTWIIALALSLLVLLIVIVLVVVWLQKRPPAETYDVDRTEVQQGHDPEAETKQKQVFPMYERAEEGPIQGSRLSLNQSLNLASDDEDLAEYDAEHYNEQASFMGEYDDKNANNGAPDRRPSASNV